MRKKRLNLLNVSKRHNKNISPFFCAGFTLVELIIVIAITSILLAGGIVSFTGLRISGGLSAGADTIKLTLEKSRLSSLVKEDETGYSVKLNDTSLVLFKGLVYDVNSSSNKIVNLPSGTKITSVNLENGGSTVSFSHLNGTTTPGTIVLSSINDPAYTRTIYVNGSGRVYHAYTSGGSLGGGGSGGQGQVADTGHQEFNLGWSIQNTSELKFKFLTNPGQSEIFIMQPHFNGNKTVFNYVRDFDAGGVDQRVTMYSNQLDPTNTIMSITRDPASSGPTLEIYIDDRLLVTYFSDGTVSAGSSGGTMIVQ
ncbi:MAG: prepilin-type N-terminal cleavage/methylation domain-containing protein [bacterium]|nr:prepilin-type N-terminal cleavage/methylation domain-containing protein [bacterium]